MTLHENKDEREKKKWLSEFLTSLLEIPCSILDIQKQSRGGAEGAEVEISIVYWGFLLACHNENCCYLIAGHFTSNHSQFVHQGMTSTLTCQRRREIG